MYCLPGLGDWSIGRCILFLSCRSDFPLFVCDAFRLDGPFFEGCASASCLSAIPTRQICSSPCRLDTVPVYALFLHTLL